VGLRLGTQRDVVDNTCNDIGAVLSQIPSADTLVAPGTAVNVTVGQLPPHPCP
jgi:beta-lactam-binding protein with PASTA domain